MQRAICQPGQVIGRWQIDRWVAAGAESDVYRAHRVGIPALAGALKLGRGANAVQSLSNEATVLSALNSDHLVRLLDEGHHEGQPWIVVTWAEGRPLDALGAVPEPTASWITHGLVQGLLHAHAAGFAHGDVKPANVRVDASARVMLLDFGSAAPAHTPVSLATTPRYAPPEWFSRIGTDPRQADVYAIGVVLAELCTGGPAFSSHRLAELAQEKRAGPLVVEALSPSVDALVQRCTMVDPKARPPMDEVAAALDRLRERPTTALFLQSMHAGLVGKEGAEAFEDEGERFTLVGEIGRGGMGIVQLLWDQRLARYVALKRPPPGGVDQARFEREARLLARLDHPGIVRVLDIQRDDRGLYFTMEYVEGDDLKTRLGSGPLEEERALRLVEGVADALAHAHEAGVVHRDVKPSNILLDGAGRPRLADFGLARPLEGDDSGVTLQGQLIGTPAYMAPEQARGDVVGPAADVFALGGVLYELLAGSPPRGDHPPEESLWRVLEQPIRRLRAVRPETHPDLEAICAWAMESDPADRPTAAELADDLRRFSEGLPVRARRLSPVRRAVLWGRRHAMQLAVVLAVVGGVGGLGAGVVGAQAWVERSAEAARRDAADARWAWLSGDLERRHAAGEHADADARFLAFVEDPETRGARSRIEAWLWEAQRREDLQDHEGALDATVRAFLDAEVDQLESVLAPLWERLVTSSRFDAALGLSEAVGGLQVGVDTSTLHQREAFLRRNFAGAALAEGPENALAAALAQATRTELSWSLEGNRLARVYVGGSGEDARILIHNRGTVQLRRADLSLALMGEAAVPTAPRSFWHALGGARVLRSSGRSTQLGRLDAQGFTVEQELPFSVQTVAPDPGSSGDWFVATGDGASRVRRWRPGRVDTEVVWPGLDHVVGTINDLAVGDLDGDDRPELVVNPAQWNAFELWVIGASEQGWVPRAHVKPGMTWTTEIVERGDEPAWVSFAGTRDYGSRVHFPEGSPYGWPMGAHLLELTDDGLKRRWSRPGSWDTNNGRVGDVDGDGYDELFLACRSDHVDGSRYHTLVVSTRPGGQVRTFHMLDMLPLVVTDLDGDGDDEVVVEDRHSEALWILGAGSEHMPILPPVEQDPVDLGGRDARGSTLAGLGLHAMAAREYERLANAAAPPSDRDFVLRAAALLEEAGRVGEAESLLRDVDGAAAKSQLAALLERDGRRNEVAEIRGLEPPRPGFIQSFERRGMASEILFGDPMAARLDPSRGVLDVLSNRKDAPLLSVPVEAAGEIRAQVDLRLKELDWGSGMHVDLRDEDAEVPSVRFGIAGIGGARLTHLRAHCYADGQRQRMLYVPYDGEDLPLRVVLERRGDRWRCAVDHRGERLEMWSEPTPPPSSRQRLEVASGRVVQSGSLATRVEIARIEIEGATVAAHGAPPHHEVDRALSLGDPETALSQLPNTPSLRRLLALDALGREAEAKDVLHALLEEGPPEWFAPALRTRRFRWGSWLRERDAPAWFAQWAEAHGAWLHSGPPNPQRDALLVRDLAGLAEVELGDDLARDAASLLLQRAAALRRAGELTKARRDLRRAMELQPRSVQQRSLRMEAARVEVAMGHRDAAFDHLELAMEREPIPERLMRQLEEDQVLRTLHEDPRWAALGSVGREPR